LSIFLALDNFFGLAIM